MASSKHGRLFTETDVFVLRGQDMHAPYVIAQYAAHASRGPALADSHRISDRMREAVESAFRQFENWQAEHPDRVKVSD